MASCFSSSESLEIRLTSKDIERFERDFDVVLNNDKGRYHFRKFLEYNKYKFGKRAFDCWELCYEVLNAGGEESSPQFEIKYDEIHKAARRVEDIDKQTMKSFIKANNFMRQMEAVRKIKIASLEGFREYYNDFIIYLKDKYSAMPCSCTP